MKLVVKNGYKLLRLDGSVTSNANAKLMVGSLIFCRHTNVKEREREKPFSNKLHQIWLSI